MSALELAGVRAVVFDAVGTLLRPQPKVAKAYCDVARRFGSRREEPEVQSRFLAAWQAEEARDSQSNSLRTDEARERRRWQTIVAAVFPEVGDQAALFAALWDHFADAASWRQFADVEQTWLQLAARGLVLAVGSNFDRRLLGICQAIEPLAGCSHVYPSSLVGHRKPAIEFYRHVATALQLPGESILMIGDDYENDFVAARRSGWRALFLSRDRAVSDAASIESLTELPRLLRDC
ncbi:MAG: HAD family hydrolase [Pirellulales bacterium]